MSLFRRKTQTQNTNTRITQVHHSDSSESVSKRMTIEQVVDNKYRTFRNSIKSYMQTKEGSCLKAVSKESLRRRAQERYCLELVLFKEDFEVLVAVPSNEKEQIQNLTVNIWRTYFSKNSSNEINIPARLSDKFRKSILNGEYDRTILEDIYKEVMRMLAENEII
eukprot:NODE_745_length_4601_cov_0.319636.p3 type:complete len:165 gc:universal NODE_745_length_4601_cov_0.319636:1131-637(-)